MWRSCNHSCPNPLFGQAGPLKLKQTQNYTKLDRSKDSHQMALFSRRTQRSHNQMAKHALCTFATQLIVTGPQSTYSTGHLLELKKKSLKRNNSCLLQPSPRAYCVVSTKILLFLCAFVLSAKKLTFSHKKLLPNRTFSTSTSQLGVPHSKTQGSFKNADSGASPQNY